MHPRAPPSHIAPHPAVAGPPALAAAATRWIGTPLMQQTYQNLLAVPNLARLLVAKRELGCMPMPGVAV
jgi:hypothetical protein